MIMVFISVEGSSMAADFEKYAINQPAVVELSKKFVCVKIEKNKDKETIKKLHAGKATRVLFITSEQKRLGEVRGYEDPETFAKKVKDVYESIAIEKKAREKLNKDSEDLEANLALAKVWVIRNYQDQAMALFQKVVDGHAGGLAAGAGRGGNGDQRFQRSGHGAALADGGVDVGQEIRRMGGVQVGHLGGVHAGSASHAHVAIEIAIGGKSNGLMEGDIRRLHVRLVEQHGVDPLVA